MGRGERGANGRGGRGSSYLHRIMFFCSTVFCKDLRRGKGFRSGCWLPLGSAMGPRCACRGEAGVVRGGRGANGRGGHGSSCLHRIMFFCSGVFCQGLRRGKGFRSGCRLLLGSTMGWLSGTTTSASAADEDLDEEEMDLVRTEGPDLSPLGCSSAAEVQSSI